MTPTFKHVAVFIDAITGEPIGGLTSVKFEGPDGNDTIHAGGRVFDIISMNERLRFTTGGVDVIVYVCNVKERFIMPQGYAASLTPEQLEAITARPWWRRLLGI